MLKGFRDFVMRGNVMDLAVAVVIGTAFTGVVTALVHGIINPLIALLVGKPNLDKVGNFSLGRGQFLVGPFLTAALNFVLIAAAVYFALIAPVNKLMALRRRGRVPEPESPPEDILLLREIRDLLQTRGTSGNPPSYPR